MSFLKFIFSKTFLIQLVLAAIALVLMSFILLQWLEHSTNQDQKITVPDLARLSLDKVDERLNELDLRREILDSANYNPDYPPYSVIDQVPLPGKFVKENRKIYLTLNPSGFRKVEIPKNLIRTTRRQVEPTLKSLGFEIGTITYKPDVARDAVLELRHKGVKLEPGDKLMKTSRIDLVLGDGSGRYDMGDDEGNTAEEKILNDLENEEFDF
jgi:eukaryotic-like serine/threonine-protein kinase